MSDEQTSQSDIPIPPTNVDAERASSSIELDSFAVIDAYPQLREMPPKEAQVVMLYASGMNQQQIASFLEIGLPTVRGIIDKHDVTKIIRKGMEMQKLFLANSIGTVMISAIAEIKKKTKDFKGMRVQELMSMIRSCVEVQKHLHPPEKEKVDNTAELLNALRAPKTS